LTFNQGLQVYLNDSLWQHAMTFTSMGVVRHVQLADYHTHVELAHSHGVHSSDHAHFMRLLSATGVTGNTVVPSGNPLLLNFTDPFKERYFIASSINNNYTTTASLITYYLPGPLGQVTGFGYSANATVLPQFYFPNLTSNNASMAISFQLNTRASMTVFTSNAYNLTASLTGGVAYGPLLFAGPLFGNNFYQIVLIASIDPSTSNTVLCGSLVSWNPDGYWNNTFTRCTPSNSMQNTTLPTNVTAGGTGGRIFDFVISFNSTIGWGPQIYANSALYVPSPCYVTSNKQGCIGCRGGPLFSYTCDSCLGNTPYDATCSQFDPCLLYPQPSACNVSNYNNPYNQWFPINATTAVPTFRYPMQTSYLDLMGSGTAQLATINASVIPVPVIAAGFPFTNVSGVSITPNGYLRQKTQTTPSCSNGACAGYGAFSANDCRTFTLSWWHYGPNTNPVILTNSYGYSHVNASGTVGVAYNTVNIDGINYGPRNVPYKVTGVLEWIGPTNASQVQWNGAFIDASSIGDNSIQVAYGQSNSPWTVDRSRQNIEHFVLRQTCAGGAGGSGGGGGTVSFTLFYWQYNPATCILSSGITWPLRLEVYANTQFYPLGPGQGIAGLGQSVGYYPAYGFQWMNLNQKDNRSMAVWDVIGYDHTWLSNNTVLALYDSTTPFNSNNASCTYPAYPNLFNGITNASCSQVPRIPCVNGVYQYTSSNNSIQCNCNPNWTGVACNATIVDPNAQFLQPSASLSAAYNATLARVLTPSLPINTITTWNGVLNNTQYSSVPAGNLVLLVPNSTITFGQSIDLNTVFSIWVMNQDTTGASQVLFTFGNQWNLTVINNMLYVQYNLSVLYQLFPTIPVNTANPVYAGNINTGIAVTPNAPLQVQMSFFLQFGYLSFRANSPYTFPDGGTCYIYTGNNANYPQMLLTVYSYDVNGNYIGQNVFQASWAQPGGNLVGGPTCSPYDRNQASQPSPTFSATFPFGLNANTWAISPTTGSVAVWDAIITKNPNDITLLQVGTKLYSNAPSYNLAYYGSLNAKTLYINPFFYQASLCNNSNITHCASGCYMYGIQANCATCATGWRGPNCTCQTGGNALNLDSSTCTCAVGFYDPNYGSSNLLQTPNPVSCTQRCINGMPTYYNNTWQCLCDPAFTGAACDQPTDFRAKFGIDPCLPHGTYINLGYGNYSCACNPGYRGQNCTYNYNPCLGGFNCSGAAFTCLNAADHYAYCATPSLCQTQPCYYGGVCTQTSMTNYTCTCPAYAQGLRCEQVDPCIDNDNYCNGGTCNSNFNLVTNQWDVTCSSCPTGYAGINCQAYNPCLDPTINPCQNNGTCSAYFTPATQAWTPICKCSINARGPTCSLLDPCSTLALSNNNSQALICDNGGTCKSSFIANTAATDIIHGVTATSNNLPGNWTAMCKCSSLLWSGPTCDTWNNPCLIPTMNTCGPNTICSSVNGTSFLNCTCIAGARRAPGVTSGPCVPYCQNTTVPNLDATSCACTNNTFSTIYGLKSQYFVAQPTCDGYCAPGNGSLLGTSCKCNAAHTGLGCQTPTCNIALNTSGILINTTSCSCTGKNYHPVYGQNTQLGVVNANCPYTCDVAHAGIVVNPISKLNYCNCSSAWTGGSCDNWVDPCTTNPCQHNGTCVSVYGSSQNLCKCANNYVGPTCQTYIDACAGVNGERCDNNGGFCQLVPNTNYTSQCICPAPYFGARCRNVYLNVSTLANVDARIYQFYAQQLLIQLYANSTAPSYDSMNVTSTSPYIALSYTLNVTGDVVTQLQTNLLNGVYVNYSYARYVVAINNVGIQTATYYNKSSVALNAAQSVSATTDPLASTQLLVGAAAGISTVVISLVVQAGYFKRVATKTLVDTAEQITNSSAPNATQPSKKRSIVNKLLQRKQHQTQAAAASS
jgi:hypothetical protein